MSKNPAKNHKFLLLFSVAVFAIVIIFFINFQFFLKNFQFFFKNFQQAFQGLK